MRVLICPKCGEDMYLSSMMRAYVCDVCGKRVTMMEFKESGKQFRFEEREDLKK